MLMGHRKKITDNSNRLNEYLEEKDESLKEVNLWLVESSVLIIIYKMDIKQYFSCSGK